VNVSDLCARPSVRAFEACRTWRRLVLALCFCALVVVARGQQQLPEDPDDEKRFGLWLNQEVSAGLWKNKTLEADFQQKFDEGASNLFEYHFQGGMSFRVRPWFTVLPAYRYQRTTDAYENRLLLNLTLSRPEGTWRPNFRTRIEGRIPSDRWASGRLRFRPGIDYVVPVRTAHRPTLSATNEFFLVPWDNPYSSGGEYTQNRVQFAVRLPITKTLSVRPSYMLQSQNEPSGWNTNEVIGISVAYKIPRRARQAARSFSEQGTE